MNKLSLFLTGIVLIIPVLISAEIDKFSNIKSELSEADCVNIEFVSLLYSDVFDNIDSTYGRAVITNDGRYQIMLGSDVYYNDGEKIYSFSVIHNQVTIESTSSGNVQSEEVTFITRLDELYTTTTVVQNSKYKLSVISDSYRNIPDSMEVFLNAKQTVIEKIEYFDINEELNSIVILNQELTTICGDELFRPELPDSVEVIRLD